MTDKINISQSLLVISQHALVSLPREQKSWEQDASVLIFFTHIFSSTLSLAILIIDEAASSLALWIPLNLCSHGLVLWLIAMWSIWWGKSTVYNDLKTYNTFTACPRYQKPKIYKRKEKHITIYMNIKQKSIFICNTTGHYFFALC